MSRYFDLEAGCLDDDDSTVVSSLDGISYGSDNVSRGNSSHRSPVPLPVADANAPPTEEGGNGKRFRAYCFTLHDWTADEREQLVALIENKCKYGCFGEEVCPTTGRHIFKDMFTSLIKLHGTSSKVSLDESVLRSLKEMQSRIECIAAKVEHLNRILYSLKQELSPNKENDPTILNLPDRQSSAHLTSNPWLNDTEKAKMRTTLDSSLLSRDIGNPWTALEPKWWPREISESQSRSSGVMDLQM